MTSKLDQAWKVTARELESMTPPQIDELFAAVSGERARIDRDLNAAWEQLYGALCLDKVTERRGRGSRRVWPMSRNDAASLAEEHLANGTTPDRRTQLMHGVQGDRYARGLREALDRINSLLDEALALAEGPHRTLLGEWNRRGRWSRMFLCLSEGGHLHSSERGCPSLRYDTPMGWLPELSGMKWREAYRVFAQGREGGEAIMCSHCYRDAPVEWTRPQQEGEGKECPATGRDGWKYLDPGKRRLVSKFIDCPECNKKRVALTPNGNIRKHDRED
ncbi:hypothetical protein [Streptomyces sp. 5-10]|uniref:hypothetical protein n=1 Tax=Streptomyces sp. 5-10 TaxID=878925 RepID=UPI00168BF369|nr:hypothetical protein [Streptomyces sp. 5-10]MBD3004660.1 hypothetical protein [Streptomyces sp. 5-10]